MGGFKGWLYGDFEEIAICCAKYGIQLVAPVFVQETQWCCPFLDRTSGWKVMADFWIGPMVESEVSSQGMGRRQQVTGAVAEW